MSISDSGNDSEWSRFKYPICAHAGSQRTIHHVGGVRFVLWADKVGEDSFTPVALRTRTVDGAEVDLRLQDEVLITRPAKYQEVLTGRRGRIVGLKIPLVPRRLHTNSPMVEVELEPNTPPVTLGVGQIQVMRHRIEESAL